MITIADGVGAGYTFEDGKVAIMVEGERGVVIVTQAQPALYAIFEAILEEHEE